MKSGKVSLPFETLQKLLTENLITFPAITEDVINDKSKGIALLQLTCFVVQVVTCAAQGLAITELELTTAALAGLTSARLWSLFSAYLT